MSGKVRAESTPNEYLVVLSDRVIYASESLVEALQYRLSNGGKVATVILPSVADFVAKNAKN